MKLIIIIAGIMVGIALLGFVALQIFFILAEKWKDKDVI